MKSYSKWSLGGLQAHMGSLALAPQDILEYAGGIENLVEAVIGKSADAGFLGAVVQSGLLPLIQTHRQEARHLELLDSVHRLLVSFDRMNAAQLMGQSIHANRAPAAVAPAASGGRRK